MGLEVVITDRAGRHGKNFRAALIGAQGYELHFFIAPTLERALCDAMSEYGTAAKVTIRTEQKVHRAEREMRDYGTIKGFREEEGFITSCSLVCAVKRADELGHDLTWKSSPAHYADEACQWCGEK